LGVSRSAVSSEVTLICCSSPASSSTEVSRRCAPRPSGAATAPSLWSAPSVPASGVSPDAFDHLTRKENPRPEGPNESQWIPGPTSECGHRAADTPSPQPPLRCLPLRCSIEVSVAAGPVKSLWLFSTVAVEGSNLPRAGERPLRREDACAPRAPGYRKTGTPIRPDVHPRRPRPRPGKIADRQPSL
jgi:hypothetical protein